MKQLFICLLLFVTGTLSGQNFTRIKTFTNVEWGVTGYEVVATFDDKIVFKFGNASDPHQLFVSDGTESGTKELDIVTSFDYFDKFINDDADYLYYVKIISGENDVLIRIDKATYAKEELHRDFSFDRLMLWQGKLYFLSGGDFKQLDPVTKTAKTIKSSLASQAGYFLMQYNDKLVLLYKDYWDNKTVLTVSDGTGAGTVVIKDFGIDANGTTRVEGPWIHNGKLYYTINARYGGTWDKSMWVSDGSEAGTHKIKKILYQDSVCSLRQE